MNPRWTAVIAAALLPALGIFDVFLSWVGGNAATFSAVLLTIRVKYPLVAHSTAYTFGVFLGHVFFPTPDPTPPSFHEVLARMMVGLSPTMAAIIMIAAGDGMDAALHGPVTEPVNQMKFAAIMLLAILAGGLVGRFVLCQHPLAPGA